MRRMHFYIPPTILILGRLHMIGIFERAPNEEVACKRRRWHNQHSKRNGEKELLVNELSNVRKAKVCEITSSIFL